MLEVLRLKLIFGPCEDWEAGVSGGGIFFLSTKFDSETRRGGSAWPAELLS